MEAASPLAEEGEHDPSYLLKYFDIQIHLGNPAGVPNSDICGTYKLLF